MTDQPGRPRPYSVLTEAEKWDWHARVYAFRRVYLGISDDVRTSPCDLGGIWFDEPRVEKETARLRLKVQEANRKRHQLRGETMIREGRDICNRWARNRGFADFSVAEQHGFKHSDVVRSIFDASRRPEVRGFVSPGAALGVTASEFKPSPERLAAGRRALGLEDDDAEGRRELGLEP